MEVLTITNTQKNIFDMMKNMEHEEVLFCYDSATGLKSIIAVHNTTLGPALGGTRMWDYKSEHEALTDVLRLSRGMTYKAAITGLELGGGKAVIIGNSRKDKSEALMRRYGKFIDTLNGHYITAEDVGTNESDMIHVRKETKHVTGIPESMGGSGDPSPVTAFGTYMGIKASAKFCWGYDDLAGKIIGVQGVGNVGRNLVEYLIKEGATVIITDINKDNIVKVIQKFAQVKVIEPEFFYETDMNIYSPCALGATINSTTLKKLKCEIIAGAANNQLEDENIHGNKVMDAGIIYAPDFLINAGGLVNVFSEIKGYDRKKTMEITANIYNKTLEILQKAKTQNIPSHLAALNSAQQKIEAGKAKSSKFKE